jgi:hypothetical protein
MDWRFHAVQANGDQLFMVATTEKLHKSSKRVVGFALPCAPALYLQLANDARCRRLAVDVATEFVTHPPPQGAYPDNHSRLFDFFQNFAAEVIFAFTAIEAFANENIPEAFEYQYRNARKDVEALRGPDIERRVSLDEKLSRVLPEAHSLKSPKGTDAWQKYRKLRQVRDRLIHLKAVDRKSSGPEHETIWGLMLRERDLNFVSAACGVIGSFERLAHGRRWYRKATKSLDV